MLNPNSAEELDVLEGIAATTRFGLSALRAAGPSGLLMPMPSGWVYRALPDGRWRIVPPTLLARLRSLLDEDAGMSDGLILVNRRQVEHNRWSHYVNDRRRHDKPLLLISPDDARARNIDSGDQVRVAGATGSLTAVAKVTSHIRGGVVSLPHGFFETNVAILISGRDGVDPLTGQPQMSGIPVTVARSNAATADPEVSIPAR